MQLIVDVGGNVGDFAIPAALANPNATVLVFEPIPELRDILAAKSQALRLSNLVIRPEAVGMIEGTFELHVSTTGEMGVSSLREFNTDNVIQSDYWRTRDDLVHHQNISVRVIRLDRALREMGFITVDFLKIDAQGEDLNVLQSASNVLVRAGMLEVPSTTDTALYEEEPALFEALEKLKHWSYRVYRIKPNDPANAEVNVFFCQSDVDYLELETSLSLKVNPIYSGKDYWWMPSPDPSNPAGVTGSLENTILELRASMQTQELTIRTQNEVSMGLSLELEELRRSLHEAHLGRADLERKLEEEFIELALYKSLELDREELSKKIQRFESSALGKIYKATLPFQKRNSDVF